MNESEVKKDSPVPLYYQIKESLKERIESGALEPHERLPSERDLENRYGISRMTARQALTELESEGYVYREQGKGSYVAEPKLRQGLLELTGFSEDMQNRSMTPGAEVVEQKLVEPERETARKLKVAPGEEVFLLKRIRTAESEPLAIETTHLRLDLCEGIEKVDFSNCSLYRTLRNEYGLKLSRAEQSVEATLATEFESNQLEVPQGAPMLTTERTTFIDDGETPVEFARSTYRGDRYKLFVELQG
ncbi:MAG: GntR family transcriptional regulator [Candidatus Acetothermia bacterium]